jgi:hypothetical protein
MAQYPLTYTCKWIAKRKHPPISMSKVRELREPCLRKGERRREKGRRETDPEAGFSGSLKPSFLL